MRSWKRSRSLCKRVRASNRMKSALILSVKVYTIILPRGYRDEVTRTRVCLKVRPDRASCLRGRKVGSGVKVHEVVVEEQE